MFGPPYIGIISLPMPLAKRASQASFCDLLARARPSCSFRFRPSVRAPVNRHRQGQLCALSSSRTEACLPLRLPVYWTVRRLDQASFRHTQGPGGTLPRGPLVVTLPGQRVEIRRAPCSIWCVTLRVSTIIEGVLLKIHEGLGRPITSYGRNPAGPRSDNSNKAPWIIEGDRNRNSSTGGLFSVPDVVTLAASSSWSSCLDVQAFRSRLYVYRGTGTATSNSLEEVAPKATSTSKSGPKFVTAENRVPSPFPVAFA